MVEIWNKCIGSTSASVTFSTLTLDLVPTEVFPANSSTQFHELFKCTLLTSHFNENSQFSSSCHK